MGTCPAGNQADGQEGALLVSVLGKLPSGEDGTHGTSSCAHTDR